MFGPYANARDAANDHRLRDSESRARILKTCAELAIEVGDFDQITVDLIARDTSPAVIQVFVGLIVRAYLAGQATTEPNCPAVDSLQRMVRQAPIPHGIN